MITILIADDNAASLEMLSAALAVLGHRIIEASNGHDALLKVTIERPDIALIDIQMPGLDGFAVLRAIRALEPPVPCRVLALTAFAMDGDRERMIASGFDGYIAKPVSISHVREQVRWILNSAYKSASHEL
ncbi:MAG TPA: response regulator [Terriglobales bacterium]|nr:response regulator [Terriglobales bacterium]